MADITLLKKETLLAMIEGSLGTKMFRHLYAIVGGEERDLLQDGQLSCAFYVSKMLVMNDLLPSSHATLAGLERTLEASSEWQKTEELTPGCLVVWEPWELGENGPHGHVGFYIGGEEVVSHKDDACAPTKHHYTYGVKDDGSPKRKIVAIYTHPILSN